MLIEKSQSLNLVEIKSSGTFQEAFLKGLKYFEKINNGLIEKSVIYGGEDNYKYKDTSVCSWNNISSLLNSVN